ncbi:hypothetical protein [Granulicella sibirica]|nr:hypothetical protein [Granulicella sibirica]
MTDQPNRYPEKRTFAMFTLVYHRGRLQPGLNTYWDEGTKFARSYNHKAFRMQSPKKLCSRMITTIGNWVSSNPLP